MLDKRPAAPENRDEDEHEATDTNTPDKANLPDGTSDLIHLIAD